MEKDNTKFDWSKEAILTLIEMWKKYECLYNPKHQFYHNKHARYTALNEMAGSLKSFHPGIEPNEIKAKMGYLRGQYTREMAKMKDRKSGASADEIYVPSAFWYQEMSFLQDFVKIRKGGCNLNTQNSVPTDESLDTSHQSELRLVRVLKKGHEWTAMQSKLVKRIRF